MHRFFLIEDVPADGRDTSRAIPLSPEDLVHAARVLRLRSGEEIAGVTPSGWGIVFRIDEVGARGITGTVVRFEEAVDLPRITLVQGVAKGDRMDVAVRMAVEVGVERIIPIVTDRTVVVFSGDKAAKRGLRWRGIAAAAAKQSARFAVPRVDDPAPLSYVLDELTTFDRVLVAWEDAGTGSFHSALAGLPHGASVAIVIGPEGGLTHAEVSSLEEIGAHVVSLGSTILRTETAAPIAIALASYEMGGMGADPR